MLVGTIVPEFSVDVSFEKLCGMCLIGVFVQGCGGRLHCGGRRPLGRGVGNRRRLQRQDCMQPHVHSFFRYPGELGDQEIRQVETVKVKARLREVREL
jgi:hypothetical protein